MLNRRAHRAVICLIMLFFFGPAAMTGGYSAFKAGPLPARDGAPRLVSLNVCGNAGTAVSPSGLDAASMPHIEIESYFPAISALPAGPSPAVASACNGDIEKPPKS